MRRSTFLFACLAAQLSSAARPAADDFAFVHISDTHFSPQHDGQAEPTPLRAPETFAWLAEVTRTPQIVPPLDRTAPVPAFGILTGDIFEYGVIDTTAEQLERAFGALPYEIKLATGNHDNTWVAVYELMRARHGGENHSFDHGGCHFALVSSASPQEPVPTLDAKTRAWLRRDLARLAPGTPVFLAMHHPISDATMAQPADYDTLVDFLRDHNVALLLYGHGHNIGHRTYDGIDGVMGGSTFGPRAGYGLISVQDGVLSVAYRRHEEATGGERDAGWQKIFQKPLPQAAPPRLFSIAGPPADAVVTGASIDIELTPGERVTADALTELTATVDGAPLDLARRPAVEQVVPPPLGYTAALPALTPGRHLLTVRGRRDDGVQDVRTRVFTVGRPDEAVRWRVAYEAGFKAGPLVAGDLVIVAGTDGVVRGLSCADGAERWTFDAGAEVLGTPALTSDGGVVFGSGAARVHCLDAADGTLRWQHTTAAPAYGWPLVNGGVAYVGDNSGRLYALAVADGAAQWTFERAMFTIESRPAMLGDNVVFGAWDGYLYAVNARTGALVWKTLGPKSSEGRAARYYAPADCGPAVAGGQLFVCDRGYELGVYTADGAPAARVAGVTSAVAATPDGDGVVARTQDDRFVRYAPGGDVAWEAAAPAGRFPVPPTVAGGRVYVCSNWGRLSVLDLSSGQVIWQYQVTPGFFVMSPLAADERGTVYVTAMDGTVTALTPP